MKLSNLYGLSLAASFDNYMDKDILDFYQAGSTTLPDGSTFIGSSLRFRYHINEWFYAGAGWDWLSKAFEIQQSGTPITETYAWNAWNPYASLGLVFFRGANSFLCLEAGAGRVLLHDSSYTLTGQGDSAGSFTGAATTASIGMGGTWFLIPLLGAEIYGGYRVARLDSSAMQAKFSNGDPLNNVRSESPFIDFSGPVIRLGLAIYLGMPDPFADLSAPVKSPADSSPSPVSSTAAPADTLMGVTGSAQNK